MHKEAEACEACSADLFGDGGAEWRWRLDQRPGQATGQADPGHGTLGSSYGPCGLGSWWRLFSGGEP